MANGVVSHYVFIDNSHQSKLSKACDFVDVGPCLFPNLLVCCVLPPPLIYSFLFGIRVSQLIHDLK